MYSSPLLPAAAEQRPEAREKVGQPFTVTPNKQIQYDIDMGADGTHSIRQNKAFRRPVDQMQHAVVRALGPRHENTGNDRWTFKFHGTVCPLCVRYMTVQIGRAHV